MTRRLRLFFGHLVLSGTVVGLLALVTLLVWYPPPFAAIEGVTAILLLLVGVDVCLGPLLTLVIASEKKLTRSLLRDLSVVGVCQVTALLYGGYSIYVARPAFVVYNTDRFDVVTPGELIWRPDEVATPDFSRAPVTGPVWVQALPPASLEKRNRMLFVAAQGGPDLRHHPDLFHHWPADTAVIRSRMKPLAGLTMDEQQREQINDVLRSAKLGATDVSYVPLLGRQTIGVVLLRNDDLAVIAGLTIVPPY